VTGKEFEAIRLTIYGKAAGMGSKTAFVRGNRAIITDANPQARKQWANAVTAAAAEAMNGRKPLVGPVSAEVTFCFCRPKSHYGTGRNSGGLKGSAPMLHSQSPDIDKLLRALFDALTGVCYLDDRLIWKVTAERQWTVNQARTLVSIE